jgi:plastocyanin
MRFIGWVALLAMVLAAGSFALASRPDAPNAAPREVVLIARDMAFVVPGGPGGPNPTLRLRAGERVRFVLENRDPGMRHDLVVRGLGLRLAVLAFGESDRQVVTLPQTPGEHEYVCSFHARLMRGCIVVE